MVPWTHPYSASQTASWSVQPFLHSWRQRFPVLYTGRLGRPLSPQNCNFACLLFIPQLHSGKCCFNFYLPHIKFHWYRKTQCRVLKNTQFSLFRTNVASKDYTDYRMIQWSWVSCIKVQVTLHSRSYCSSAPLTTGQGSHTIGGHVILI